MKESLNFLNNKEIKALQPKEIPANFYIYKDKIEKSFGGIVFAEGPHKYFLDGQEITCVSNMIHEFQPPKDWDEITRQYAEKNELSVEAVKRQWFINNKIATSSGTRTHEFAESCFHFYTGHPENVLPAYKRQIEGGYLIPNSNKEIAVSKFWNDMIKKEGVIPMLCETRIHTGGIENIRTYAGTFDLLMYVRMPNGKDGVMLMDYKTNNELYKTFPRENNQMLLPPFNDLYDEDYSVYVLQQSAYQIPIERLLGVPVLGRRLVWLKDDATYELVKLPDRSQQLMDVLDKTKERPE